MARNTDACGRVLQSFENAPLLGPGIQILTPAEFLTLVRSYADAHAARLERDKAQTPGTFLAGKITKAPSKSAHGKFTFLNKRDARKPPVECAYSRAKELCLNGLEIGTLANLIDVPLAILVEFMARKKLTWKSALVGIEPKEAKKTRTVKKRKE